MSTTLRPDAPSVPTFPFILRKAFECFTPGECKLLSKGDECRCLKCAADHLDSLTAEHARLREALEFYADPMTYFAIAFIPDGDCGELVDDFEDVGLPSPKPGKRARAALTRTPQEDRT